MYFSDASMYSAPPQPSPSAGYLATLLVNLQAFITIWVPDQTVGNRVKKGGGGVRVS